MSNGSNEQGNDTTAPAFQVGDRVRFDWFGETVEGVVRENCGAWLSVENDARGYSGPRPEACTLISRATPASAPAPTSEDVMARSEAGPRGQGHMAMTERKAQQIVKALGIFAEYGSVTVTDDGVALQMGNLPGFMFHSVTEVREAREELAEVLAQVRAEE